MKSPLHVSVVGEGPVLVALHGFMGTFSDWEMLQALPVTLVRPDLPGHGGSVALSPDLYGFDRAADELASVIRSCTHDKKCFLLGYSLGGRLAVRLALQYPELFRHVVVESGTPGLLEEDLRRARSAWDHRKAEELRNENLGDFLDAWYRQPLFKTLADRPELLEPLIEERLHRNPLELALALEGMGGGSHPGMWHQLESLQVDLTVIYGEADRKYARTAAEMIDLSPRIRTVMVTGAGHNTHLEQPGVFMDIIRKMISEERH